MKKIFITCCFILFFATVLWLFRQNECRNNQPASLPEGFLEMPPATPINPGAGFGRQLLTAAAISKSFHLTLPVVADQASDSYTLMGLYPLPDESNRRLFTFAVARSYGCSLPVCIK